MENQLIRGAVVLGVPGFALVVFYLLLRTFNFQFSQIGPDGSTAVVVLFLLIVWAITAYVLHRWAPIHPSQNQNSAPQNQNDGKTVLNVGGEEFVTLTQLLRSMSFDVVKIDAHTHVIGVAAEYEWVRRNYPNSKIMQQALTSLALLNRGKKSGRGDVHFDLLTVKLADGRTKDVYFDISSFFKGASSSFIDKNSFAAQKITELYKGQA
jgi:hypothetical protein